MPGLPPKGQPLNLSQMNVQEPLKEWLKPSWKQLWSGYWDPEHVAIWFDETAPGYDYDKVFDTPYSGDAWGVPGRRGIFPAQTSLHMVSRNYTIVRVEYLDEVDPRWVKAIRHCPSRSDFR